MELRNFTPHCVRLKLAGNRVLELPSEGVARVATKEHVVAGVSLDAEAYGIEGVEVLDVQVYAQECGEVTGLPKEEPGVFLVVSNKLREHLPKRLDLVSPGGLGRDASGRVTHATMLLGNAR